MRENEALAHALVKELGAAGIAARVTGEGVHWQVEVETAGARALTVGCFWYHRAISGLMLGMNPGNARSRLRSSRPPYEGPEYAVTLRHDGGAVAEGRTHTGADVVACTRAWLAGVELDQLVRELPFIDEKKRAIRAVAQQLDPSLRRETGPYHGDELWVYGDGRSCRVSTPGEGKIHCGFLLGQAQVAFGAELDDAPAAVAAWLLAREPVGALPARVPGVELERHAEVLEVDPAKWHWLHVRDRIADPDDVLAPLRDLLEALAASPIATRFFTFSSLARLCFSASSHYPWVQQELPVVERARDGGYLVGDTRCSLARALKHIETKLAASPVQPFFGSQPHHDLRLLSAGLTRQGSTLRPRLVQREAWYDLVVTNETGTRQCRVSNRRVVFSEAATRRDAAWPTYDEAARAIRRFCEEGESLDAVVPEWR